MACTPRGCRGVYKFVKKMGHVWSHSLGWCVVVAASLVVLMLVVMAVDGLLVVARDQHTQYSPSSTFLLILGQFTVQTLQRLRESGLVDRFFHEVLEEKPSNIAISIGLASHSDTAPAETIQSLTLKHLQGAFLVLGIGVGVALLLLLTELGATTAIVTPTHKNIRIMESAKGQEMTYTWQPQTILET